MEMATGEKVVSFLCSFFFARRLEFFISLKDFWGFQNPACSLVLKNSKDEENFRVHRL
jgi:hypothetical protein